MTAVTGTVSSTTGTVISSSASGWTNVANIYTSNNAYAVAANSSGISNGATTGYLYALGNGFSIPLGATIDGLEIAIEAKNAVAGTGFRVRPVLSDVFLRYSGADQSPNSPTGVSIVSWAGTSDATQTLGSSTASWGASLTPTIINDASFGVRVRFQNLNATTQSFSVDRLAITVYYTDSAGIQSSQQLFMYEG
jgi:hypothetical protein